MTLFVIFLWLLHLVSVIFSLVIRAGKRIPVLHAGGRPGRNWKGIRTAGMLAASIMLLYIAIMVLLGWTLRWYTGLLVLQLAGFLILDRYLIAVNYSPRFWSDAAPVLRSRIVRTRVCSYIYITLRSAYLIGCILLIPMLFLIPAGFTLDTVVYGVYSEIKGDQKILKRHTPFGFELNPAAGAASRFEKATYFDGRLIFYYKISAPDKLYVFTSSALVFMKYADYDFPAPVNVNPAQLAYDKAGASLYLDGYTVEGVVDTTQRGTKIIWDKGSFYLDQYTRSLSPSPGGDTNEAQVTIAHQKIKF